MSQMIQTNLLDKEDYQTFSISTLYYIGDKELLFKKGLKIGIIGSRNCTDYGEQCVKELISRLDKDVIIISGLAKGIDGLAHRYALQYGLHTIGIIGSGLKYQYPYSNIDLYQAMYQHELVISEYEDNEPIKKHHFVERNRIIAAMSDILIVIESSMKSGTHITVNDMLELGKDVYVIPHNLLNKEGEGNNYLIYEGANIIYDLDEFIKTLHSYN